MGKGLNKEASVSTLKKNWESMEPSERKNLIQSLMGHRMKFSQIAKAIGRNSDEVRDAWRGIIIAENVKETAPNSLINDCGNSDDYQGVLPPYCAGGSGCKKCWAIYNAVNNLENGVVNPKVLEVAPLKSMYTTCSFDDILAKYREFIGWSAATIKTPPEKEPINKNYLEGIIISDIHAPFHNEEAIAKLINQTKGKVDVCILAGDGPDFHSYSRFTKYGTHFSMRDEHKSFMAVLAMLSESYPQVIMIPGNHDERTRKKYAQTLPADLYQSILDFHGPNAFDFSELMTKQFENILIPETPKSGFAEYRFLYQVNDIIVGHPELFSKISCKSVANFIDWLKKKAEPMGLVNPFNHVVMGHTHQSGKVYADFGIIGIENASLCMVPDYDASPKLSGAVRPPQLGYTRFRTNWETGITDKNDINLIYL